MDMPACVGILLASYVCGYTMSPRTKSDTGLKTPGNNLCKLIYLPVCGNDGETYSNECFLNREKKKNPALLKEHNGRCHGPTTQRYESFCNRAYAPVCGNDGETYINECVFELEQERKPALKMMHYGSCDDAVEESVSTETDQDSDEPTPPQSPHEYFCTNALFPVCGNDGETYANECFMDKAKEENPALKKVHNGPCDDEVQKEPQRTDLRVEFPGREYTILCKLMYWPICANNGETYNNECLLNREKTKNPALKKEHDGPCAVQKEPQRTHLRFGFPCITTLEFRPVCGTDGNTYANPSALECIKRHQNPALEKKYDGECLDVDQKEPQLPNSHEYDDIIMCTYNNFPVCGNDGRTYLNECFLHNAKKRIPGLKKVHKGPCEDKVEESISTETDTDSDEPTPSHEYFCTNAPFPICGNDGETYANECFMDKAKEENPALKKVHNGPCDDEVQKEPQRSDLHVKFPVRENILECKLIHLPVCANDGKTYGNECLLNLKKKKNPALRKKHDGPCDGHDAALKKPNSRYNSCTSTLEHFPVCGTDGKTYGNPSILNCEKRKNTALKKKHLGPCRDKVQKELQPSIRNVDLSSRRDHICNMVYSPICASDGETYGNECFLNREMKKNPALKKKYLGECLNMARTRKNRNNKAAQRHILFTN